MYPEEARASPAGRGGAADERVPLELEISAMQDDADDSPGVEALVKQVEQAGAAFAHTVSQASYAQGHVAWPREIALAHQKVEEALMWAVKGLGGRRP